MNLWILHYSFINHQFHHSTITIKEKIIINKLVTELLWGHFLWKNSCSNEKRQIPRQKDEFHVKIPRLNSAAKFCGSARNSAGRWKLWALVVIRSPCSKLGARKNVFVMFVQTLKALNWNNSLKCRGLIKHTFLDPYSSELRIFCLPKHRTKSPPGGAPHKCWNLGPQLPCYATDINLYSAPSR